MSNFLRLALISSVLVSCVHSNLKERAQASASMIINRDVAGVSNLSFEPKNVDVDCSEPLVLIDGAAQRYNSIQAVKMKEKGASPFVLLKIKASAREIGHETFNAGAYDEEALNTAFLQCDAKADILRAIRNKAIRNGFNIKISKDAALTYYFYPTKEPTPYHSSGNGIGGEFEDPEAP